MSQIKQQQIDFIIPVSITKIVRPQTPKPQTLKVSDSHSNRNADKKTKTFEIQKSFIPEKQSDISVKLRPQIEKLKKLLKAQREKQKKTKQLIAEGKIERKDLVQENEQIKKKEIQENKEKFIVDKGGQLRDQKGNLVFVKNETIDLKINQKKAHQQQFKDLGKKQKIKFHQKLSQGLRDKNLVVGSSKKRIKKTMFGLQFVEEDLYYNPEQTIKEQIGDLDEVIKLQANQKYYRKRRRTTLQFNRDVPDIQWWDKEILLEKQMINGDNQENNQNGLNLDNLINIEKLSNPVTYQKVGQQQKKEPKVHIPVFLTKDQRKKLKRKRKREKLIEKNDKIRLGLIEPEKPKLKISNMAIVMKNQFIMDPSRVQQQVKKQMQGRLEKHLQSNNQRKLTKAQRKEKMMKKLKRDSAKECRRIVFKLRKFQNISHIFKVNTNARQLVLSGFILKPNEYYRMPVIIAAEGGQKAIRFFKNLMLNRIKWSQDGNQCKILWQGQIQHSKLGKWRTIQVQDQLTCSKALKQRGMDNFYEFLT